LTTSRSGQRECWFSTRPLKSPVTHRPRDIRAVLSRSKAFWNIIEKFSMSGFPRSPVFSGVSDDCESAPRGAICPGGVRGLAPGRRNGREKLEGSTDVGGAASGGKRPSTIEQRSAASGPRAVARKKGVWKPIPVVEASILVTGPETGGYGLSGRSVLVLAEDRLVRSPIAGGEAGCRVAGGARRCPRGTAGRRPCRPAYE
jgi:hypothetical protein